MSCFACCFLGPVQQVRGQFSTVLNLPPGPDLGNDQTIESDTQVNLSEGGRIGYGFHAGLLESDESNVEVNISGGRVGGNFRAYGGSVVNLSGGRIDRGFEAVGSTLNISDGRYFTDFDVLDSTVNISGGSISSIRAAAESVVNIRGGTVSTGVSVKDNSILNIFGGTTRGVSAEDSKVNLFEGLIGSINRNFGRGFFRAGSGSVINVFGGSVGDRFIAESGSVVNILGRSSDIVPLNRVLLPSGSIGRFFQAKSGSEVNISGGKIGRSFIAESGSEVNLIGTEFSINRVDITETLTLGVPITIDQRDVSLSGLFAEGSPFSFHVGPKISYSSWGHFHRDAKLTLTLVTAVPEPACTSLLISAPIGICLLQRQLL